MRYECEVLSPVHIGTGATLSPLEFTLGQRFAVFDFDGFFAERPARAEEFCVRLGALTPAQLRSTSLDRLLTDDERRSGTWVRYTASVAGAIAQRVGREAEAGRADVRVAIKTPDDRPFLPGTSLKGALRTALAYAWIRTDETIRRNVVGGPPRDMVRRLDALFRGHGFGGDPTTDLLRAVEVGDSEPIDPAEVLALVQEEVLSAGVRPGNHTAEGSWKRFATFLEVVRHSIRFQGRLGFPAHLGSSALRRRLGWDQVRYQVSPAPLLDTANLLARDICDWELRYFRRVSGVDCAAVIRFYEGLQSRLATIGGNESLVCLGRGAGWHKSTIGMLLETAVDFDFIGFRRARGVSERRDIDRTGFEFPKTRKLIMDAPGRPAYPLGWVLLRLPELPADRPHAWKDLRPLFQAEGPAGPARLAPTPLATGRPAVAQPPPPVPSGPPRQPGPPPARPRPAQPPEKIPPLPAQPKPSKLSKAAEKAKREQERIRRRYSGEEEPT